MEIKLIAIDLDGTTLNSNDKLSEENQLAIETALSKGIIVVPTTGRPFNVLPKEILNLKGIKYAINSNGGCVTDISSSEVIYTNLMPMETAKPVLAWAKENKLNAEIYTNGHAYAEKAFLDTLEDRNISPQRKAIIKATRTPVDNISTFAQTLTHGIEKINITVEDEKTYSFVWESLQDNTGLCLTNSVKNLIEINNASTSKADGLSKLCQHLNISPEHTMALGDGLNDTKMFQFVNYSVVMGNAPDHVKAFAKYETGTNDENGLAQAFNRFL